MILNGSRYQNSPIVTMTVTTNISPGSYPLSQATATETNVAYSTNIAVFRSPPGIPVNFTQYMVKAGDRFDTIAYEFFGRPDLWWYVADANPEIFFPENLQNGAIIRIPQAS